METPELDPHFPNLPLSDNLLEWREQ